MSDFERELQQFFAFRCLNNHIPFSHEPARVPLQGIANVHRDIQTWWAFLEPRLSNSKQESNSRDLRRYRVNIDFRVENAWPSIVDKETFQQVQKIMSKNAPRAIHPRIVPSFYLLSGILVCTCGSAMVGRSAKSHRYYYYTCNRNCKQGKEACNSRILPKEKIERLVIDQIKSKILDGKYLEELVRLINVELDAGHFLIKEQIVNIESEIHEVENRLSRLYDAIETGKLDLNDLAPRIKELRAKQDDISKAGVVAGAEMMLSDYQQLEI